MNGTPELLDELRRIDQAWRDEQERYQITFKDSDPKLPSGLWVVMSLFGGMLVAGAGWIFLSETTRIRDWNFNPMFGYLSIGFGILFILTGIGLPIFSIVTYVRYKSAYRLYLRRRSIVVGQLGGEISNPGHIYTPDESVSRPK